MSAKLVRRASGFLWADSFDPASRAAATSLTGYDSHTWSGSPSVAISAAGYLSISGSGVHSLSRFGVTTGVDMVMEVDGWIAGLPATNGQVLSLIIDAPPFASDEFAGYRYREINFASPTRDLVRLAPVATIWTSAGTMMSAAAWHSFKMSRVGSVLTVVRDGVSIGSATDGAPVNAPPNGFALRSEVGSAAMTEHRYRNLAVYRATTITVKGLTGTQIAQLLNADGSLLPGNPYAGQSGGVATIDVSGLAFAPFGILGKLRVQASVGGAELASTGPMRFWGGDSFQYAAQPTIGRLVLPL